MSYNTLLEVMTKEEELNYYNTVLDSVIQNPRYYLDNLETLDVFKVSFINYHKKRERFIKEMSPIVFK